MKQGHWSSVRISYNKCEKSNEHNRWVIPIFMRYLSEAKKTTRNIDTGPTVGVHGQTEWPSSYFSIFANITQQKKIYIQDYLLQ